MSCVSAIALSATIILTAPVSAQQTRDRLDQLPEQEQATLKKGRVLMKGEQGKYTGRVLVNAPLATAWDVLTDYDRFEKFFPRIASSKLLQSRGNQKVFEQVNVIRIFLFRHKSKVVIAATESHPSHIAFRVIKGNIDSLEGSWQLEPVSSNRVLITHQVNVVPRSSASRSLFFRIYKNTLTDTLAALKREVERRSAGRVY